MLHFWNWMPESFWHFSVLGNSVKDWILAVFVFLVIWVFLRIFRKIILARAEKLAKKTSTAFDDELVCICENISGVFYTFLSFYFAFKLLHFGGDFEKYLDGLFIILVVFESVKIASRLLEFFFRKTESHDRTALFGLKLVAKIILWSTGVLLVLSNLGFNITALGASLGIGGVAVALAAQNILGDLFSSFSIYFDKPFQIGDYIQTPAGSGTVEKIGLKTTRMRSITGDELIIANRQLTDSAIHNFGRLLRRRADFSIGVVYSTPRKTLEKIPKIIRKIVETQPKTEFNWCHFREFGDWSLNFSVSYFINSADYLQFLDVQQAINLEIVSAFEKEKIEIAFPTRTVQVLDSGS